MSQLYARVFLQILDSSIAENFTVRHIFEDFLKLSDAKTGVVDMTRQALSRRLNVPIETLNEAIATLEKPDESSRDMEFQGRRIERLDEHRDWGWKILNWEKYDSIRTRADGYARLKRHREKAKEDNVAFNPPNAEEVKLYCSKAGISEKDGDWFFNKCEGNGWKNNGKNIVSWQRTLTSWKIAGYLPGQKTHGSKSSIQPRQTFTGTSNL